MPMMRAAASVFSAALVSASVTAGKPKPMLPVLTGVPLASVGCSTTTLPAPPSAALTAVCKCATSGARPVPALACAPTLTV